MSDLDIFGHRLSPRALRVLRRQGRLVLRASVTVRDAAGRASTKQRRLVLVPGSQSRPGD